ncbi:MAG: T9SS type A sorting domain-containing protein [Bacteroidetes bacterium]|nr:MAG: T9SS type A sorting domain-containing protein [Bacteroidota bacterium]
MRIHIGLFLLCLSLSLNAQDFWKKCSPIPKGEFPFLIQGQGTQIHVLSGEGNLFRSDDMGKNWYELLQCDYRPNALYTNDSLMLVADSLFVYRSSDAGQTWQKQRFQGSYAPMVFFKSSGGYLFALSGDRISLQKGDRIWRSADNGLTWQKKSLGLQGNGFIEHLKEDAKGRLYTLTADDGQGGALFYSDDQGEHWTKQPILFDGQNAVNDDLYIRQAGSLLLEGDSITLGFHGSAGTNSPVGVRLTLKNHLNMQGKWRQIKLSGSNSFWMDIVLLNTAYNGCSVYYGSFMNTLYNGGGIIKYPNGEWVKQNSGLDITPMGYQGMEISALANGTLVGLQWGDYNVYYSDSVACYPLSSPQLPPKEVNTLVYPQPAGNWFSIASAPESATRFSLYDMQGRLVLQGLLTEQNTLEQVKSGSYILQLEDHSKQALSRLRLIHF